MSDLLCRHTSKYPRVPDWDGNTGEKLRGMFWVQPSPAMWHRLKNLFFSFRTYGSLSPDLKVRQLVNRSLRQRTCLSPEAWADSVCLVRDDIDRVVALFVYDHLGDYSGLEFGRVLLSDRLIEDLRWTEVCWFDWQLHLYEDFWQQFGVDISDCFDEKNLSTVADLITFLNYQQARQQIREAER